MKEEIYAKGTVTWENKYSNQILFTDVSKPLDTTKEI